MCDKTIRIKIESVVQCLLIYLLLTIDGSFLFDIHENIIKYCILGICIFVVLVYPQYIDQNLILTLIILLFGIAFVRILNDGGVGLRVWSLYAVQLLIASIAVRCNRSKFVILYIKVVVVLSIISLVFWAIGIINPVILKSILIPNVAVNYNASTFYGMFLYVMRDDTVRNVGIYPEPAGFQVALNMALFLLLFYGQSLGLSRKQINIYTVILIATLLSAQSTTGFLSMAAVLLGFIISKKQIDKDFKNIKGGIFLIIAFALCYLMIDFRINGNHSLITRGFIDKLFNGNKLDLGVSTGRYRIESIQATITSIFKNPLGIGYDKINALKTMLGRSAVGNGLFTAIAAEGVISIGYALYWMFKPIIQHEKSKTALLVIIFMFINSTLSQAIVFYPSFIIITILNYDGGIDSCSAVDDSYIGQDNMICC